MEENKSCATNITCLRVCAYSHNGPHSGVFLRAPRAPEFLEYTFLSLSLESEATVSLLELKASPLGSPLLVLLPPVCPSILPLNLLVPTVLQVQVPGPTLSYLSCFWRPHTLLTLLLGEWFLQCLWSLLLHESSHGHSWRDISCSSGQLSTILLDLPPPTNLTFFMSQFSTCLHVVSLQGCPFRREEISDWLKSLPHSSSTCLIHSAL